MHQLGDIEISRVVESEGPFVDVFGFLPDAQKEVIEANRDWLMPRYIDPETMMIILNIQSYILIVSAYIYIYIYIYMGVNILLIDLPG